MRKLRRAQVAEPVQFLPAALVAALVGVQAAVWPAAQPAEQVVERAELAVVQWSALRALPRAGLHFAGQAQAEFRVGSQAQPEPLVPALPLWPEPQQEHCWELM